MSDLPAILDFFLVPVALYVVPALIARSLIKPDRRWSSDASLLFVLALLNHRLISGPELVAHRIGPQLLLVLVGAGVLVLFPLSPPIGHF